MEIIINELSLAGQFENKDKFFDNLEELLPIIKLIDDLNFSLFKNHLFFSSKITKAETLNNIACSSNSRDSRIRRVKSYLLKLSNNPPYWNASQKHNCQQDTYLHNSKDICNTSLAEASQRDKTVLSFKHNDYTDKNLVIQKNNTDINILNIFNRVFFLDSLYKNKHISPLIFCLHKFSDNLNFEKLETEYGFGELEPNQINQFITTFNNFSSMSWTDINNSDGLEYKSYSGDWFRNKYPNKTIHKFRVSQKYRCFGYRENNVFYALRFETSHKISDEG